MLKDATYDNMLKKKYENVETKKKWSFKQFFIEIL
jgi:hypothetical protein